jgi:hypothetical protein
VTEVEDHLHAIRTRLLDNAELARDMSEEQFVGAMKDLVRRESGDDIVVETFGLAAPYDHLYLGLERYWRKKAEADAA